MEQFLLEKWLKDKSRKVVTRTGEEVKIIDTNAPEENNPIVGYIYHNQKWNGPWSWHIDGVYKIGGDDMDLFFADEEENLSEDEKIRKELIDAINGLWDDDALPMPLSVKRKENWLDWFEKQGVQKSVWSEEDENGFGYALWAIQQAKIVAKNESDMGNLWYAERFLKSIKARMKGE